MTKAEYLVVVTASGGVTEPVVARIAETLGLSAPRRLGPGAVEFATGTPPGGLRALADDLEVDINLVPAANRLKKLLIADMDSTIIPVECIDELADFAGVKPQVAEITERAMRGELDFEEAIDARVGLLKGLPETALEQCYHERVRLNPGARELVTAMNARGAFTALVSGGFSFFTARVAREAGFAVNQANTLVIADGILTGEVRRPILGQQAKLEALRSFTDARGIGPEEVIAVGDGANDLAMIRAAGLGVAFHAKPALRAEADAVLDHSDLSALLALQGISA